MTVRVVVLMNLQKVVQFVLIEKNKVIMAAFKKDGTPISTHSLGIR